MSKIADTMSSVECVEATAKKQKAAIFNAIKKIGVQWVSGGRNDNFGDHDGADEIRTIDGDYICDESAFERVGSSSSWSWVERHAYCQPPRIFKAWLEHMLACAAKKIESESLANAWIEKILLD